MILKTKAERQAVNGILRRIYELFPSVAAWAKSGKSSPLWDNPQNAMLALSQYVGPNAQRLFMDSLHIAEPDRDFLRSLEASDAMSVLIDLIYHPPCPGCPHLKDGLIIEEPHAASSVDRL